MRPRIFTPALACPPSRTGKVSTAPRLRGELSCCALGPSYGHGDDLDSRDPAWALPIASSDTDWREFRAQLVKRSRAASDFSARSGTLAHPRLPPSTPARSTSPSDASHWAHILPGPEQGCVLLANPLLFGKSQTHFDKSVILMLEHSANGSMGIILNKPSDLRLEEVQGMSLGAEFGVFSRNRVHLGGDVDAEGLYLLHEHDVDGVVEIRRGLFLGGANALCEKARDGAILPQSVKWFCRYAGWAPHQLDGECARNVWYPVSCSTSLLTRAVEGDGRDLWHEIMELVGDDFKRVSEHIRADADVL